MQTTYPAISISGEANEAQPISERVFGYVSEFARDAMHELVLRACEESGISKATIAKRMKKDPAQISRLLGAPGNWTIDTCAELLHAIDGSFLQVDRCWPQSDPSSNERGIACFKGDEILTMVPMWSANHLVFFRPSNADLGANTTSSNVAVRRFDAR